MAKHFIKMEYSEFDQRDLDKFTFMGYVDELMPVAEIREQIKTMGLTALFMQIKEQVKEDGVIEFFFVIDDETDRIKMYEKGDILKLLEYVGIYEVG